ncbi:translation initiation factor IF-3 [Verrucomicrobia bacterium LW23]|nr:translation initiation factor IF-3 [Verrucomicrobia bacterium LW23]
MRANNKIRAREVLVIDVDGKSLGVVPIAEAMTTARRRGLDLVEVSPNAVPPVCRILDFGKYRYEISKRDRDGKKNTSATKVKELKFQLNIDGHDFEVKMRQAESFLMRGMKVKLIVAFRGREMMHQDRGTNLIARIRADLAGAGLADSEPRLINKNITMMLTPNPVHKRVRKFTHEDDEYDDSDDSDLIDEHDDHDDEAHDTAPAAEGTPAPAEGATPAPQAEAPSQPAAPAPKYKNKKPAPVVERNLVPGVPDL